MQISAQTPIKHVPLFDPDPEWYQELDKNDFSTLAIKCPSLRQSHWTPSVQIFKRKLLACLWPFDFTRDVPAAERLPAGPPYMMYNEALKRKVYVEWDEYLVLLGDEGALKYGLDAKFTGKPWTRKNKKLVPGTLKKEFPTRKCRLDLKAAQKELKNHKLLSLRCDYTDDVGSWGVGTNEDIRRLQTSATSSIQEDIFSEATEDPNNSSRLAGSMKVQVQPSASEEQRD